MEKLTEEKKEMLLSAVTERFEAVSKAKQFIPEVPAQWSEKNVKWNRFDFQRRMVIDGETIELYIPRGIVPLSKMQVDEINEQQNLYEMAGTTTVIRVASNLARVFDKLVFSGFEEVKNTKATGDVDIVVSPPTSTPSLSLREACIQAEMEEEGEEHPIVVDPEVPNQSLVSSIHTAVLKLEERGYYSNYYMVLGDTLARALNTPSKYTWLRAKDVTEYRIDGGFYESTTIPYDEAYCCSLDGSIECVTTKEPKLKLDYLGTRPNERNEEIVTYELRMMFAPRIRENRAIVRLKLGTEVPVKAASKKGN